MVDLDFIKYESNLYIVGLAILLINFGSKYLVMEFSDGLKELMMLKVMRRIVLFSMIFAYTRSIKAALVMTAVFIVLTQGLFNEQSRFCILPKSIIKRAEARKAQEKKALEEKYTDIEVEY